VRAGTATFDVAVVGAGLIGLATAVAILAERPGLRLAILEKENAPTTHQSGRNSGVLHAGVYYAPGSLKSRLCTEGRRTLLALAEEHGIPHRVDGKLVVAAGEGELDRLAELERRARANGLAVEMLEAGEWRALEPNVHGVRALHVPESGVIDYTAVGRVYRSLAERAGARILLGHDVRAIERIPGGRRIRTAAGDVAAARVVACAGLQADRVARMTGLGRTHRVVPFRGDYFVFRPPAHELVRALVYPVPDPAFPFLGVHFTRRVDGSLVAGPNAVPALAREGYGRLAFDVRDLVDVLSFSGFHKLARSYASTGAAEIWRDFVKPAAVRQMRKYLPMVRERDVAFGPCGIRAQVMTRSGDLVDDFLFEHADDTLHVLNAPSPGATASAAIGREVARRAVADLAL
jgi:L-2-hydroxyglutarate oxidase LhgO